jgi:hypothetical protein
VNDKLKAYRDSLSQEDKDNLLKQAQAARMAKAAERDANAHLLKTDYLDATNWVALASKYKVRMPHQNEKASVKGIRKYLKKAGVGVEEWNDAYTGMKYFVDNNPRWTAYGVAGLVLEMKEYKCN